jgi:histidyl-tRNA synthetase
VAIIIGEDELAEQSVTIKYLRGQHEQQKVPLEKVPALLNSLI